jgi:hypothetical protein
MVDSDIDDMSLRKTTAEHLLSLKAHALKSDDVSIDHMIYDSTPLLVEELECNERGFRSFEMINHADVEERGSKRKIVELEEIECRNDTEINVIQVDGNQWLCNICKDALFGSFVEACMHEISCDEDGRGYARCSRASRSDSLLNNAVREKEAIQSSKSLGLSLIPKNQDILSEYNYLLTQHIELFEVQSQHTIVDGLDNFNPLPAKKIGLRCIHCTHNETSSTSSTFFPSAVSSIASGVGTIGARHLSAGKCERLCTVDVDKLKSARKISQQQTRNHGRVGLDVYLRDLAKRCNIVDQVEGGIRIADTINVSPSPTCALEDLSKEYANEDILASTQQREMDENGPSFIKGDIEHFWECKHCNILPIPWRASGSVIFTATMPSMTMIENHLSFCQGVKPLPIPRNAEIESLD